ncbi:hypothetical protein ACFQY4_30185 [Catellatospora bangladeshensis]|uniref:Uncharacterized protein n=1 Tax=Catellatospora bangladeshensis TaxID=310355 RepID=A0A8J3J9G6_9ACTN|nr:hypothetical protein [Catellatospora bangladeshensis]GIF80792.1 hypothetical protein Cba03nite_21410 [Catellatospora bangladeshensis]
MNDVVEHSLHRLRAADPAVAPPDPHDPYARALLDRVLATEDRTVPTRPRRLLPRLAIGAAAVLTAGALAVVQPWSAGDPATAYTVDRHPDGSVSVTIRAPQLTDPAKLNAELARSGTPVTVLAMVPAERCPVPPGVDPAFQLPPDPTAEQRDALFARMPVRYELRGEQVVILIQPWKIPAGDTLVLGYTIRRDADRTTLVWPAVVTAVPSCVAEPVPGAGR